MAKTHLTDAAVERYRRPQTGRTEISDSEPGLFLWVTASGTKSWVVIYRLPSADGKRTIRKKAALGRHPAMSVAAARVKARENMELAAEGIDPEEKAADEKAGEDRAASEQQAGTFAAVASEYVLAMQAGKLVGGRKRAVAPTTAAGRDSLLKRNVIPQFGDKPLAEISPQIVARTLAKIEAANGSVDETLKVIRGVFKFAQSRGLFHGALPTGGMTNRQAPTKETRSLSDDELRAIWLAAGQQGWPFGSVIRLLMLTGQRKNEIAALRWDEVNENRQLLVIPRRASQEQGGRA